VDFLRFVLALALGYAIGAIPAGYYLVRLLARTDVRRVAPYNVGIRTLIKRVGPAAAVATLLVDAIKGAGAVVLASALSQAATAWAVPAVIAGW